MRTKGTRRSPVGTATKARARQQRPSPQVWLISGTVGDVFFDDGNTLQAAHCLARGRDGAEVYVELEIYPRENSTDQRSDPTPEHADITLHFGGYKLDATQRAQVELKANEIEPLAVALSRAVANAKARGFLPATGAIT